MFKNKSIMKQQGFTLLELLVVITLLAILAVGGLVAYDGIGNNAGAAAGAYNTMTLDRAIRQHQSINNRLPDQWDNLANPVTGTAAGSDAAGSASSTNNQFLALTTRNTFGAISTDSLSTGTESALFNVISTTWGMGEVQNVFTTTAGVAPGKQHNEGSNISTGAGTGAIELAFNDAEMDFVSILPTAKITTPGTAVACQYDSQPISNTFAVPAPTAAQLLAMANRQNAIHDDLGASRCHLVLALGFGGDAAASTMRRQVQIAAAPIYSSQNVLIDRNYNRLVGLFHMQRGGSAVGATNITGLLPRPRLLTVIDPEGGTVDTNVTRALNPN